MNRLDAAPASGLTISQRENPGNGRLARTLTLLGSCAPLDTLTFGVTQRAEVEWVPGSTVASVRLDGPEESPTDFAFKWRGRRYTPGEALVDGQPIDSVNTLVDIVSEMVRDSVLVDVSWAGVNRVGVMAGVTPEEGRTFEFDVTLSFTWVASPNQRRRAAPVTRNPAGLLASLQAWFDEGMADVDAVITFKRNVVDDVQAGISKVRENLKRISNASLSLRNVNQEARGVYKTIGDTIQQIFLTTDDISEAAGVSADGIAQSDSAWNQNLARLWRASTLRKARLVRHTAALARAAYRPESSVLGVHEGVIGDTIWSVARKWYGDSTQGFMIADYNNLISTSIQPGQRLVIPSAESA
jgi:hypothetical protein